jgi:hypothetical protein
MSEENKICDWEYSWTGGIWITGCRDSEYFEHGQEQGFSFCPYCGKVIKLIKKQRSE